LLTDELVVMDAMQARISSTDQMELLSHNPRDMLIHMLIIIMISMRGRFAYIHQLYKHANLGRIVCLLRDALPEWGWGVVACWCLVKRGRRSSLPHLKKPDFDRRLATSFPLQLLTRSLF